MSLFIGFCWHADHILKGSFFSAFCNFPFLVKHKLTILDYLSGLFLVFIILANFGGEKDNATVWNL